MKKNLPKQSKAIVAGNRLIAESPFSGFIVGTLTGWIFGGRGLCAYKKNKQNTITEAYSIDKLQYHLSWNALIPVVESIAEARGVTGIGVTLNFLFDRLGKKEWKDFNTIQDLRHAIIEYIKWYNIQPQKAKS